MASDSCFLYIITDDFQGLKVFKQIQGEDTLQFFWKFESPGEDFTLDDEETSQSSFTGIRECDDVCKGIQDAVEASVDASFFVGVNRKNSRFLLSMMLKILQPFQVHL